MPRTPSKRLATYRAKRHFDVTPEPSDQAPTRGRKRGLRFMIHKHDATRLHYDLRLEIDGALASWAVPKGPSFDPADRRLAVQTEDHPLAYADFEGRIPEGEYGAGDSIIWDSGTFDTVPPGQGARMREKGHIEFELKGEKLRGRWHLVRTRMTGGKQQWLLFKAKDAFAAAARNIVAERPESVASGRRVTRPPTRRTRKSHSDPIDLLLGIWPPMLATLGDLEDLDPDREWAYEVKYDGFRALAGLSDGRLSLQSRKGNDLTERFPTIAKALRALKVGDAVFDGEVVAVTHNAAGRFQDLQQSQPDQRYAIFDLLWLDGVDLRARPYTERRELLEQVLAGVRAPIVLSQRLDKGDAKKALREARRMGSEGVLAKAVDAPYQGTRSKDWLKLKLHESQEVVLVGYLPIKTGAKAIGALLAAVHDAKGYRYVGKIGTGFTMDLRKKLWRELEKRRIDTVPVRDPPRFKDIRWVRPELVGQVEFTEWTQDARLRHPSFQGLREDKSPEEVVRERKRRRKHVAR